MLRKDVSLVVSMCFAALLAGCRADQGKSSATVSEQISMQQPVAPQQAFRPLIICFGDSLTAGYGADPGESFPDDLQKLLNANDYPYRVVNEGVSGNTTKDAVQRLARVVAAHPEVVLVELGGNDGLRGLPLEQTKQNIASIIDQLQTAHAKVALAGITLPPSYGPDYIAKFNAIFPALARQYKVPYIPFLLQDVYGKSGDMQDDGIHATDAGNRQVAENVAKLIAPLLKH
jgi:acyl-CoA thioesterase-1